MSDQSRENCPWKCRPGNPKCLCKQVEQTEQDFPASHWRTKYREIFNENKLLRAEIERLRHDLNLTIGMRDSYRDAWRNETSLTVKKQQGSQT